jgi:hypothetical protein
MPRSRAVLSGIHMLGDGDWTGWLGRQDSNLHGGSKSPDKGSGRKDRNVYLPARVPSESVKATADVSRSHISGEPERTASA